MSIHKVCELSRISRRVYYYQTQASHDGELQLALEKTVQLYPRYGYRELYYVLRCQGWSVNHKRVYRLYKQYESHNSNILSFASCRVS